MNRDVQRLGEVVKRGRADRAQDAERGKTLRERRKEVTDAPQYAMLGFWCGTCRRDYNAQGMKQIRAYDTWPIAWYGALCPSGHVNIRRITDKIGDPYYHESEYIRREQAEHADDFMLPSDPRFRYKYPVQWARIEAERERREQMGGALTT